MKFLVDAQLPRCLCIWLRQQGHDAVHTLDLDSCNRTPDADIIHIADQDGRIVIKRRASSLNTQQIDPRYFRPAEVETLLGDPSKAKDDLRWVPEITLDEMVA